LAIVEHYALRDGKFDIVRHNAQPMDFVVSNIPDGTPFRIYKDSVLIENDVTEDYDALQTDGVFYIIEGPGGGVTALFTGALSFVLKPIMRWLTPSVATANVQAESANNRLTNRTNEARPYKRTYDICGEVECYPSNLMKDYTIYNSSGKAVEYGYFDVARGYVDTPADGIYDGDTLLSNISGSSAAVYEPYTSPNNGSPTVLIGDAIAEPLFITVESNEVDGETLKAPNDQTYSLSSVSTVYLSGTTGILTDSSGDNDFSETITDGDSVKLIEVVAVVSSVAILLSGTYTVTAVSDTALELDVSGNLAEWQKLITERTISLSNYTPKVTPADPKEASFSDWVTMSTIKQTRLVANVVAENGIYKTKDGSSKRKTSVTAEMQYQLLDDSGVPYGPYYTAQNTVAGRTASTRGASIIGDLPVASYCRARCRRVTNYDFSYDGTVVDEIKYEQLYGQIEDTTAHYGNRTTIHTARKQTIRATSLKSPKLSLMTTELVYKYLGNGVFDTERTTNTQAVQSLIRLMNDPEVGGLTLTTANMDALLSVQDEIETYFDNAVAGQFCYTFDDYTTTAQDIIGIIAEAVFCKSYRQGHSILLDFDRPRSGPSMVFTHRSKAPSGEKWSRTFNDRSSYDSLKFQYIDPDDNTTATISIPEDGGLNTETYTSKGVRNYQQAYWLAWRRYQRNTLARVSVEFNALEEGALAKIGRTISVVKGPRVAPYDGYVVAVDGLKLTLSQPVEFTDGLDHSILLKMRDGSVQSRGVTQGANNRQVVLDSALSEAVYVGNSALKTEFSFGSDDRHAAQHIVVSTVEPGKDRTVKITGYNYTDDYYLYDGVPAQFGGFSNGFSNGFN